MRTLSLNESATISGGNLGFFAYVAERAEVGALIGSVGTMIAFYHEYPKGSINETTLGPIMYGAGIGATCGAIRYAAAGIDHTKNFIGRAFSNLFTKEYGWILGIPRR